jgi:hypothetical protein
MAVEAPFRGHNPENGERKMAARSATFSYLRACVRDRRLDQRAVFGFPTSAAGSVRHPSPPKTQRTDFLPTKWVMRWGPFAMTLLRSRG